MRKPESHQIDTEAENLFRNQVPPAWVLNSLKHDYGIDFTLQVFTQGQSTHYEIYIQLKGCRTGKISGGNIHIDVRVSNLRDYETRRVPVFLVVADLSSKSCHYLFIQKHLHGFGGSWRSKKTLNLKIPCAHALADHEGLMSAIVEADRFMAVLHPAAFEAVVEMEVGRLMKLDPRFSVTLDLISGKRSFQLSPKVPVSITVTIPKLKAIDLINRGLPTSFAAGELVIHGSDIFAELAQGVVTLHFSIMKQFQADVLMRMPSGEELLIFSSISMNAECGQEEARMLGSVGDLVKTHCNFISVDQRVRTEGGLSISLAAWTGLPVSAFPHFTRLKRLFDNASRCEVIILRIEDSGNHVTDGRIKPQGLIPSPPLEHLLGLFEKSRAISSALGVEIVYPGHVGAFPDTDAIDFLHFVSSATTPKRNRPTFELKWNVTRKDLKDWRSRGLDKKGLLRYELCCGPHEIWGATIDVHKHFGRIMVEITDLSLRNDANEIEAFLQSDGCSDDPFTLCLHASESSMETLTKHATDSTFHDKSSGRDRLATPGASDA